MVPAEMVRECEIGGGQALGLDVEQMLLCQPDSGEMALEVADSLVRSNAVSLIAIDSVAALVPRSEIEGEIGTFQGAHVWSDHWSGSAVSSSCPLLTRRAARLQDVQCPGLSAAPPPQCKPVTSAKSTRHASHRESVLP